MSSTTPSGSPSSEESFARFLEELERHPALRFEDWLSREPESRRPELRSLHEAYRRLQPNLPEGALVPAGSRALFRREERERPQPAPGLSAGKVVGDFRQVSLIGQGGMGQVWEAEQVSLRWAIASFACGSDVNCWNWLSQMYEDAQDQYDYYRDKLDWWYVLSHPSLW